MWLGAAEWRLPKLSIHLSRLIDQVNVMRNLLVALLVTAACGGDGDGRPVDAQPEADAPAADSPVAELPPLAPVTLTVLRDGKPVQGVHTYFLDFADVLVTTVDTDAAGTASAVLTSGSVTAIDPFAPAQPDPERAIELRSWIGVKPGDHLVLSQSDPAPITVTINAPRSPDATSYDMLTTCGREFDRGQPTGTITLSGCNGVADVLIVARSRDGNSALYRSGVVVADQATVDLTAGDYRPFKEVAFHYSHVPSTAESVSVDYEFGTPNGRLRDDFEDSTSAFVDGSATITLAVPDIPDGFAALRHSIDLRAIHDIDERQAHATSYDLDLAGLLLPDWMEYPRYDAANRRIAWVDAAGGAAPDFQIGVLDVTPAAPTRRAAGSPAQPWNWLLIAPYTAGQLKLPALPNDVADWTPQATDDVEGAGFAFKLPGGYDALREKVFTMGDDIDIRSVLADGERIIHVEN